MGKHKDYPFKKSFFNEAIQMNPLTKIHIQGFKSIVDQTIEPGQINILIGANGSGKTAILEAIGILSAAMNGTVDNEALQRRGVRLASPQLYQSSFENLDQPQIAFSLEWQDVKENEQWHYTVELEPAKLCLLVWHAH
jgi:AAA15 family ATPase/GTPase